ncbi:N-acetylmuramoyl-L-alanine amidase [Pseudomonas agarici]|uniref:N-acetylmuramoyl-L-alanine amidase n=1 Tax=Pseudomonas agarici TaxID=46677 RepID=A0A0X1SWY6_PSEAA|nr:N-acetylmuramoyl-L-alanine amidase [Pseudomonas agarici]AMB84395.1 N-acetylmuramoyl-L-alanine amidase [Pseudomonas agarici]NWB89590.1 N-acetylmuramoyl-L-alanine amidase [Pseudomonas agarici]NWC10349.1 N-acetylmuramoyl-L-alanine amidase [Pseudomonas agarici]SEK21762.1 N-acetylmuramoyl-L-alanine amidase [Pseudomonas agarici]
MNIIKYNAYRADKSFDSRVRFLVMHYTATNFQSSINSLTGPHVSAHYLVPDPDDASYIAAGYSAQNIFNLVNENDRAWHAGASAWGNRINLNDSSIGIEIVNLATDDNGQFTFPPYPPTQIEAIKELALNILARYPTISPVNVVGHSDISIGRKSDPGAAFPWQQLHQAGIGAWYDETTKDHYVNRFTERGLPQQASLLTLFKTYGYETSKATSEQGLWQLIRAFQLHFRASNYDGRLDIETAARLAALVKKYFPASAI